MLKFKNKKLKFGDTQKLNLSSTFFAKSICKKCGSVPTYYYLLKCSKYHKSISDSKKITQIIQRSSKKFNSNYYLLDKPSSFNSIKNFSIKNFLKYKTRIHSNYSVSKYDGNLYIDCFSCSCRHTVWQFKQFTPTIESKAKSSSRYYPVKLIY